MAFHRTFGAIRRFSTSALRRGGGPESLPPPGHNLPIDISNRFKLTAVFILYFGSGLALPFITVRHQTLKK